MLAPAPTGPSPDVQAYNALPEEQKYAHQHHPRTRPEDDDYRYSESSFRSAR